MVKRRPMPTRFIRKTERERFCLPFMGIKKGGSDSNDMPHANARSRTAGCLFRRQGNVPPALHRTTIQKHSRVDVAEYVGITCTTWDNQFTESPVTLPLF